MSIAGAAIAAASIGDNLASAAASAKKSPPKRTALAVADVKLVPEPR